MALLALHERPLRRPFVAGTLWPDTNDDHAVASLRSALWRLGIVARGLVDASTTYVSLNPNASVDYREACALARDVVHGVGEPDALFRVTTPLLADILPDWYDDWVVIEQEQYRQLRLDALEALARRQMDQGVLAEATQMCRAVVAVEPLRESAHRLLMEVYIAQGNKALAIHIYHCYRELLRRELETEPSHQMDELVELLELGPRAVRETGAN